MITSATGALGENWAQMYLSEEESLKTKVSLETLCLEGGLPEKKLIFSKKVKLAVWVPMTHSPLIRDLMGVFGGVIGEYEDCTVTTEVEGRWRKKGDLVQSSAKEHRVEVIVPRGLAGTLVRILRIVHPYETMGYDLSALLVFEEEEKADARALGFESVYLEGRLPVKKLTSEKVKLIMDVPKAHAQLFKKIMEALGSVTSEGERYFRKEGDLLQSTEQDQVEVIVSRGLVRTVRKVFQIVEEWIIKTESQKNENDGKGGLRARL